METKKETLSDKFLSVEDVKEFVKELKEESYCGCGDEECQFIDRRVMRAVDELAGQDLI